MEEKKSKRTRSGGIQPEPSISKRPVSLGLANLGNTCYANSVIQVLNHIKEFKWLLSSLNSKHFWRLAPNETFCSIWYMLKIMKDGFTSTSDFLRSEEVLDIIKNVWGDSMMVGMQQDAHEFLVKLIENFSHTWSAKNIKPKTNIKWDHSDCNDISKIFKGTMVSSIKCSNWKSNNKTMQPFFELNLDLDKKLFEDEYLEGNNQYSWSNCDSLTDATKTCKIESAPPILIVSLNRFNHYGLKMKTKWEYPTDLDLSSNIQGKKKNLQYELIASIVHDGRFSFKGHYYSYVKSFNKKWYKLDDSHVTEVTNSDEMIKWGPYILFYSMKPSSRKLWYDVDVWEHKHLKPKELKPFKLRLKQGN
jgi:ubiquitin carboxyl-terminal hydrolase 36/42